MRKLPRDLSTICCLVALVSCTTTLSSQKNRAADGPPIPTALELSQDRGWISNAYKAKWVYVQDPPSGFRAAYWIPLGPDYELPGSGWLKQQPIRQFANGPGQLTLRTKWLDMSNVFNVDDDVLEITGDWKNGRLVRAVRIMGAGELAARKYDWDVINAGIAGGLAPFVPFVWAGSKLYEGMKSGSSSGGGSSSFNEGANESASNTEVSRFMAHFAGQEKSFSVVHDDGGGFGTTNDFVLLDSGTGKKFSVGYTHGFEDGLGGSKSLQGRSLIVVFDSSGRPSKLKSPETGRYFQIEDWKATGFGW